MPDAASVGHAADITAPASMQAPSENQIAATPTNLRLGCGEQDQSSATPTT